METGRFGPPGEKETAGRRILRYAIRLTSYIVPFFSFGVKLGGMGGEYYKYYQ